VAAVLAATIIWLLLKPREVRLAERVRSRDDEISRLRGELGSLRAEAARLANLNTQFATQLEAERAAHVRLTNESSSENKRSKAW
jgi:hypothetical protein